MTHEKVRSDCQWLFGNSLIRSSGTHATFNAQTISSENQTLFWKWYNRAIPGHHQMYTTLRPGLTQRQWFIDYAIPRIQAQAYYHYMQMRRGIGGPKRLIDDWRGPRTPVTGHRPRTSPHNVVIYRRSCVMEWPCPYGVLSPATGSHLACVAPVTELHDLHWHIYDVNPVWSVDAPFSTQSMLSVVYPTGYWGEKPVQELFPRQQWLSRAHSSALVIQNEFAQLGVDPETQGIPWLPRHFYQHPQKQTTALLGCERFRNHCIRKGRGFLFLLPPPPPLPPPLPPPPHLLLLRMFCFSSSY